MCRDNVSYLLPGETPRRKTLAAEVGGGEVCGLTWRSLRVERETGDKKELTTPPVGVGSRGNYFNPPTYTLKPDHAGRPELRGGGKKESEKGKKQVNINQVNVLILKQGYLISKEEVSLRLSEKCQLRYLTGDMLILQILSGGRTVLYLLSKIMQALGLYGGPVVGS